MFAPCVNAIGISFNAASHVTLVCNIMFNCVIKVIIILSHNHRGNYARTSRDSPATFAGTIICNKYLQFRRANNVR